VRAKSGGASFVPGNASLERPRLGRATTGTRSCHRPGRNGEFLLLDSRKASSFCRAAIWPLTPNRASPVQHFIAALGRHAGDMHQFGFLAFARFLEALFCHPPVRRLSSRHKADDMKRHGWNSGQRTKTHEGLQGTAQNRFNTPETIVVFLTAFLCFRGQTAANFIVYQPAAVTLAACVSFFMSQYRAQYLRGDLDDILTQSRRNNAMLGITGLLLSIDGGFCRSGRRERAVRELYNARRHRSRHANPHLMLDREVPVRAFPNEHGVREALHDDPETAGMFGVAREAINAGCHGHGPHRAMMLQTFYACSTAMCR